MADIFENIEENFQLFRDMVKDVPNRYYGNIKEIEKLQQERQDILHMIELVPFNAYQGFCLSRQLKEIQQERRRLKDENRLLEPMVSLLGKYKKDLDMMNKILGEVRERNRKQGVRVYRCRIRKDLQKSIDQKKVIGL